MLALVTGEIGAGKTTVCRRVLELLRAQGVTPGGILSPARLDAEGVKVGIDALDVATGERRQLAEYVLDGGQTIGPYTFCQKTLAWAVACLETAIASSSIDLLVVDEIGPLELVYRDGFVTMLEPLSDPCRVPHALVVVRRRCVDVLDRRIGRMDARRFRVDRANRDALSARMAAQIVPLVTA